MSGREDVDLEHRPAFLLSVQRCPSMKSEPASSTVRRLTGTSGSGFYKACGKVVDEFPRAAYPSTATSRPRRRGSTAAGAPPARDPEHRTGRGVGCPVAPSSTLRAMPSAEADVEDALGPALGDARARHRAHDQRVHGLRPADELGVRGDRRHDGLHTRRRPRAKPANMRAISTSESANVGTPQPSIAVTSPLAGRPTVSATSARSSCWSGCRAAGRPAVSAPRSRQR